jgi:hypothetical protein
VRDVEPAASQLRVACEVEEGANDEDGGDRRNDEDLGVMERVRVANEANLVWGGRRDLGRFGHHD